MKKITKSFPLTALRAWSTDGSPKPFSVCIDDKTLRDANGDIVATFHSEEDLMFAGTAFGNYLESAEGIDKFNDVAKTLRKLIDAASEVKI